MMIKKAFITGITGQDGSYLAEFLLEKGYEVHGLVRRSSTFNRERIKHLHQDKHNRNEKLFLHYGDITDSSNLFQLIQKIRPDEIYNLAAQSHVGISFKVPEGTAEATGFSVLKILEAVRSAGLVETTRVYQASTSELFGKAVETPQTEKTPFYPRSPYGVAKLYGYWIIKNYREAYNLFGCNGILFNHESPRRGKNFVSKKVIESLVRIKYGKQKKLGIGNLEARRDWGYAKDYVESMWLMLQQDKPEDYIIATGETHTVRELIEETCSLLGINIVWQGSGIDEKGINSDSGEVIVDVDPNYFRPTEVDLLLGNPAKARTLLGWQPKVKFKELIKLMTEWEVNEFERTR
jgi:GDPmannose 4,6-dehydratase